MPTTADSSIGGPLLWPTSEPWPMCLHHIGTTRPVFAFQDIDTIRRLRARDRRYFQDSIGQELNQAEREFLHRMANGGVDQTIAEPTEMVAIAQFYAKDIPTLPMVDGNDLLQVLWCPFSHDDELPLVKLCWRASHTIRDHLATFPTPSVVGNDDYIAEPCTLDPESIVGYPSLYGLTGDLRQKVSDWNDEHDGLYQNEAGQVVGWRIGGNAAWGLTDIEPIRCPDCGAETELLLHISSPEWAGVTDIRWRPFEEGASDEDRDSDRLVSDPTMVNVLGYRMQIFTCVADPSHQHCQNIQ
jgi:hypothetical protein